MAEYSTENKPAGGGGKFVFLLLLLFAGAVAYVGFLLVGSNGPANNKPQPDATNSATTNTPPPEPSTVDTGKKVEINIAYGTEKKLWLQWTLEQFNQTPAAARIKVNLYGRGSVEGAHEVLNGPGKVPIHVWSPASSTYRDVFENEWKLKYPSDPIIKSEELALSPMVFVIWEERYQGYATKYPTIDFNNIALAMQEPGGWGTLCNKPEWGLFKFAHTHPNQSNSGLVSLVLMAYDFNNKERGLSLADITKPEFQNWLADFQRAVARPSGELVHSTGTLMKSMVLRGPSQYDCLMVYENLAIDYLKAAQGRWGNFVVVYPERNMWNNNPYYILDVPWSSAEQRAAAAEFLDFLMSEPIQAEAIKHGFRPGNPTVPINTPDSPFVQYAEYGLKIDILRVCEAPKAEVLTNLVASFQRVDR